MMVRILANGDIVQDDDPRAQQRRGNQGGGNIHGIHSSTAQNGNRGGQQGGQAWYGGGAGGEGAPDNAQDGQVRQVSIFEIANQKLLDLGIPRLQFGGQTLEPIVLVGFLLAMLMFGLPGLIFGGLLFAVVKMSQGRTEAPPHQGRRR